ncbi:hypothetical protein CPI04_04455 [Moraxella catarrhalis]|nr:hypothetical protein [Moraxella catarrhalis]
MHIAVLASHVHHHIPHTPTMSRRARRQQEELEELTATGAALHNKSQDAATQDNDRDDEVDEEPAVAGKSAFAAVGGASGDSAKHLEHV